MTATVIKYPIKIQMECSGCGASFNAPCDCGMSYVPAGARAKKAVEADPEKSSRAIAADIGVDEATVRRARKSTAANAAVRIGRDGKKRKQPKKQKKMKHVTLPGMPPLRAAKNIKEVEQQWQFQIGMSACEISALPASWTRSFGDWQKFSVPPETMKFAEDAAKTWNGIVRKLQKRIIK